MDIVVERIIEACDRARESGLWIGRDKWGIENSGTEWRLAPGSTGNVCPMGAVLLYAPYEAQDGKKRFLHNSAARSLGVELDWIFGFTEEFDNPSDDEDEDASSEWGKGKIAARAVRNYLDPV